MVHEQICSAMDNVNKIYGPFLLIFFFQTTISGISYVYQTILDLNSVFAGGTLSQMNSRACDIWAFLNFFSLCYLIYFSIIVNKLSKTTLQLIHRLTNLYPKLEEFVLKC